MLVGSFGLIQGFPPVVKPLFWYYTHKHKHEPAQNKRNKLYIANICRATILHCYVSAFVSAVCVCLVGYQGSNCYRCGQIAHTLFNLSSVKSIPNNMKPKAKRHLNHNIENLPPPLANTTTISSSRPNFHQPCSHLPPICKIPMMFQFNERNGIDHNGKNNLWNRFDSPSKWYFYIIKWVVHRKIRPQYKENYNIFTSREQLLFQLFGLAAVVCNLI